MRGFYHFPKFLSAEQQQAILTECRAIAFHSPLFTPTLSNGAPFNYQMTNCGDYGWISDQQGYRYTKTHPVTGQPWAAMPDLIKDLALKAANSIGETNYQPQSCLINYYPKGGKLGLHQDRDEKNKKPAILSLSLGDSAIFLLGGLKRSDRVREILIKSGDLLILSGEARMAFHGIKQILPGTSDLLKNGGRLNLTIRQYN